VEIPGEHLLTAVENAVLSLSHGYHSGFCAYSRRYPGAVNLPPSDDSADTEIIAAGIWRKCASASAHRHPLLRRGLQIDFGRSCVYGLSILGVMARFKLRVGLAVRPDLPMRSPALSPPSRRSRRRPLQPDLLTGQATPFYRDPERRSAPPALSTPRSVPRP
jgi:hypothetical protein